MDSGKNKKAENSQTNMSTSNVSSFSLTKHEFSIINSREVYTESTVREVKLDPPTPAVKSGKIGQVHNSHS
uniref:Uncharacterized protein n=1 Tax=Chenopodium quinoa TaxID=63459 RepID=A0A803KWB4_CHEQI